MSKQPESPVPVTDAQLSKGRRAPEPQPIDPVKLPALPYYERHPDHRPPRLTPRQQRLLRRRGRL